MAETVQDMAFTVQAEDLTPAAIASIVDLQDSCLLSTCVGCRLASAFRRQHKAYTTKTPCKRWHSHNSHGHTISGPATCTSHSFQLPLVQANEALQSCLSIQETALGLDHPDVADTLQEMALTVQAQGLKHQAEPVLRQCLAIRSHALGMQHPDTAAVLHALSTSLPGSDR